MKTITLHKGDRFTILDNGTELTFKPSSSTPSGPYTKYPGATDWGHPTVEQWEMTGTENIPYNENIYVESGNNIIYHLVGSRPTKARRTT